MLTFSGSWRRGPQNGQSHTQCGTSVWVWVSVSSSAAMNFRIYSFWYTTQVEQEFQIFQSKQCLTISIFGHFPMMVHSRLSIPFIQLHAICQETLYGERLTVFLIWKYCLPQTEGSFLIKNTMKLMTHICCSLVVLVCSHGMNGFRQTPQNLLQSCKTKYQMECLCLNACV